jgi:hypothetical protein
MRFMSLLLVAALPCSGCGTAPPTPSNAVEPAPKVNATDERRSRLGPIDAIELTGPTQHAKVNRDGSGYFYVQGHPREKFAVTREAFRQLEGRLFRYRKQAEANDPDAAEIVVTSGCVRGLPYVTGAGLVTVRWTSPGVDDFYLADLGCDRERNADRNADLRAILATLPAPKTRQADLR